MGEGAFGAVFRGKDVINGREVALKIIDKDQMFAKYKSAAIREKLVRYWETEERCMRLCRSANVVKLYNSYDNEHEKVLVMEYCRGGSLEDFIGERKSLEEDEAIYILKQMIFGLAEAHQNKIVHRDLKPENILVHEGVFKLGDFGLSKELPQADAIFNATECGSKPTMAPEVKNNQKYGLKADIWSLGMIFFMMVYPAPELDLTAKFRKAMQMVEFGGGFRFRTKAAPLSKEASDFLAKTIVVDQHMRMGWSQMLDHQIFDKLPARMPEYISISLNEFDALKKLSAEQEMEEYSPVVLDELSETLIRSTDENPEQINAEKEQLDTEELNGYYLECKKA